jgi:hypothetical protein
MAQDEFQDTNDITMNTRKKLWHLVQKMYSFLQQLIKQKNMANNHNGNLESRTSKEDERSLQAEGSSSNLSQEQSVIGTAMSVVRTVSG